MVVVKQFSSSQFTNLNNIAGRVLYDNTLNILRFNDSNGKWKEKIFIPIL